MSKVLARWESRGRAHYAELEDRDGYYGYSGNGCGGTLPSPITTDAQAVRYMQAKVDQGYFLPDRAIVPMKRVI
jgi:hypothetical protein